jgi:hypothetical protein
MDWFTICFVLLIALVVVEVFRGLRAANKKRAELAAISVLNYLLLVDPRVVYRYPNLVDTRHFAARTRGPATAVVVRRCPFVSALTTFDFVSTGTTSACRTCSPRLLRYGGNCK